MIKREVLKEVIISNEDYIKKIENIVERESLLLPKRINKTVVLYGVRRSGKSYCLYDIFKQNSPGVMYIDFEDERLDGFSVKDFQNLKEAFLELKPDLIGKEATFLLDEVQSVKGWEKFARRMVEKEKHKVFVSGSSSKMTPQELHTSLRGRSWGIEIFPFSFREYLKTKKLDLKEKSIMYGERRLLIKKYFLEYLRWGGFPEVCLGTTEIEKRKIIREYLDAIFFKDLVERFKITNIYLLDALREKLFSSFGLKLSLNAFYKQHKDRFPFSKDSLFAYYKHFLESLIVFEVRIFSPSSYKRLRNPAKVYLIDTGISKRLASEDLGRSLENAVFLEIKRKGHEVFYFEGESECDFVIKNENGGLFPIQVSWEITAENQERELRGLIEACKFLGVNNGMVLTHDQEKEETKEGIKIEIMPVWKWMFKKDRRTSPTFAALSSALKSPQPGSDQSPAG